MKLLTNAADRIATIRVGRELSPTHPSGTWMNGFVADLASDVETLLAEIQDITGRIGRASRKPN